VRRNPDLPDLDALPVPVRLFVLALIIRWALSRVGLSLLARQFWSNLEAALVAVGIVWLLLLLDGWGERYFHRYLRDRGRMSALSVLRPARRVVDMLVILVGVTATLYRFGVDPTTALAGFGVGGIAIALAARKTLENILAGVSLISDDAIRVGDFLKVGDTLGTVQNIGLRYTQIRTLDRSLVSIANAQMGSMTLENLSTREKFWFHPIVGLRYETTPAQLRAVLDGIRALLVQDSRIEPDTVSVRLLRFARFSLDVEIFAYVLVRDWSQFLNIQEQLLLRVLEIVQEAGTHIAIPSQQALVVSDSGGEGVARMGVSQGTPRERSQR
jgi:MscS family membrane protein